MNLKIREAFVKLGYYTKPDFIIIGVQKAGTTGLFRILEKHSNIVSVKEKEIHYFDNDDWYNENKISQYHSYFPLPHTINKKTKVFEATPLYIFHPEVAYRLHKYNPDLKLILMLREPAERAFSAWTMYNHHFKTGISKHLHDPRSFSKAIAEEIKTIQNESYTDNKVSYVKRGIYHQQIEKYLQYFNKEQLLILEAKSLRHQTDQVLQNIQDFIGVPYEKIGFESANSSRVNEKEKYLNDINNLKEFYKPYNEKLFDLIGKKFDWNS